MSSCWWDVEVRRGVCQLKYRPRHLTMVENYVLDVLEGLEYSDNPGSYAGGSLTTGRVSHAGQVLVGPRVAEQCDVNLHSLTHIDLEGNEIADTLAKAGARDLPEPSAPTLFWRFSLELNTRIRPLGLPPRAPLVSMFSSWRLSGSQFYKTASNSSSPLSRSGHIKSMKFSEGRKSFEMCTNCSSKPDSPAHILECLGLTKQDLADVPLLVLDYLKVYGVMDLVC
ncbi:RNase H domain-containing protein [Trichonephila clavipes]|nr:RNase H domain-containing protein [Trichonephila clavipes]